MTEEGENPFNQVSTQVFCVEEVECWSRRMEWLGRVSESAGPQPGPCEN